MVAVVLLEESTRLSTVVCQSRVRLPHVPVRHSTLRGLLPSSHASSGLRPRPIHLSIAHTSHNVVETKYRHWRDPPDLETLDHSTRVCGCRINLRHSVAWHMCFLAQRMHPSPSTCGSALLSASQPGNVHAGLGATTVTNWVTAETCVQARPQHARVERRFVDMAVALILYGYHDKGTRIILTPHSVNPPLEAYRVHRN